MAVVVDDKLALQLGALDARLKALDAELKNATSDLDRAQKLLANLEASKLYSGLIPHMVDFEKALRLIKTAQKIDPTYCDVHHQFGHVYFQQGKYIKFEKEMVKALLCPFTMGQAMGNWKKYWNAVLAPWNGKTDVAARKRYDKYMKRIEESIDREAERSGMESRASRIRDGSNLEDEL